jgi:alpha-tubulin suppressor-like RCC1 family protein
VFADDSVKKITEITEITFFKDICIKDIACGYYFCVGVTDCDVYSWGSNRYGQLGLGSKLIKSMTPMAMGDWDVPIDYTGVIEIQVKPVKIYSIKK